MPRAAMVVQARRVSERKLQQERQRCLALQAQLDNSRDVIVRLQNKLAANNISCHDDPMEE